MIPLGTRYHDVQAKKGGWVRPPVGGYVLRCARTKGEPSTTGKPMLTLFLDVAEGEYKESFKEYPLRYNQTHADDDGLSRLKAIVEMFQASNPGLAVVDAGGNLDERLFVGKLIGAAIREEEYLDQGGQVRDKLGIAWFAPIQEVREGKVKAPPKKLMDTQQRRPAASTSKPASAHADDTLPF